MLGLLSLSVIPYIIFTSSSSPVIQFVNDFLIWLLVAFSDLISDFVDLSILPVLSGLYWPPLPLGCDNNPNKPPTPFAISDKDVYFCSLGLVILGCVVCCLVSGCLVSGVVVLGALVLTL